MSSEIAAPGLAGRKRLIYLAMVVLMVGLLFSLAGLPQLNDLFPEPWDKLVHWLFFATLAGLLWGATGGRWPLSTIALTAAIGALDEWHQSSLAGRHADYFDFLTDLGAAVVAVILLHNWRR